MPLLTIEVEFIARCMCDDDKENRKKHTRKLKRKQPKKSRRKIEFESIKNKWSELSED